MTETADEAKPHLPGSAARAPRLRFRYSKLGKIRFTGHRDVARMWERAFRRSGLPVAWSEGFSPHPLLSFGLALPTGSESRGEYLDVTLEGDRRSPELATPVAGGDPFAHWWEGLGPGGALAGALTELLPDGIDVQVVELAPETGGSLQQEVSSCSWELEVLGLAADELGTRVEQLLHASSLVVERERKGRRVRDDLRPAVLSLAVAPRAHDAGESADDGRCRLEAELATRPRGVRPRELTQGLGQDVVLVRSCRRYQWIERDGARREPLEVGAPHAGRGASYAGVRAT